MLAILNSDLFWRLFNIGIPTGVYVVSISFGIIGSIILLLIKSVSKRHIITIWLSVVLFLMLYSTVIGRESQPYRTYHLIPFWSFRAIQEGLIEILYEKLYNVLFFIPYGVLLGAYSWPFLKRKAYPRPLPKGKAYPQPLPKGKGVLFWRIVLIGFLTSVGIELLQLVTRTGTCETDDVICNTLGCGIGAVIGSTLCWLIGMVRNK